jgi:hypothetical protein
MGTGDLAAKEHRDHNEATCHVAAENFIASCERFGLLQYRAAAATKAEDRQKLEIRNPKSETISNFVSF